MRRVPLIFLLAVLCCASADALMNPHNWDRIVPKLAVDAHRSNVLQPDAFSDNNIWGEAISLLPGLEISQSTQDMLPDVPFVELEEDTDTGRLEEDAHYGTVPPPVEMPLSDFKPLSEEENVLMVEGQKLWDSMTALRSKLAATPALLGTPEGKKILEEFESLQRNLEDIKQNLQNSAQPVVNGLIEQFNKALAPVKDIVNQCGDTAMGKLAGFVLGPLFTGILRNIQLLSSSIALAEVIHVTSRITASCAGSNNPVKKALVHMQRADNGLVSAGTVLDRIMSDVMARRPVEKADISLFGIEQHDVAVQLANVRSNLDAARSTSRNEAHKHISKAKRWALASGALAATAQVAAAGPVGLVTTAATLTAAAANTVSAMAHGRRMHEIEQIQTLHDDAIAEHTGLQAQFKEATQGLDEEPTHIHAGNAHRIRSGKIADGQRVLGQGAHMPAELADADGKARGGPEEDRHRSSDRHDDRERQRDEVVSVLRELMKTASSGTNRSQDTGAYNASSIRERMAATPSRPSALRPPTKLPTPAPAGTRLSPRPSGLRQPTATPPPNARGVRWFNRQTGSAEAASLTPPPVQNVAHERPQQSPIRRRFRATATPDGGMEGTGRTSHVSLAENAVGRRLEDQLLQLLHARMEVATDQAKKDELQALASHLRQATRAARQQVRAYERTELVLQDCVDPELRERIMNAQQEATKKTQEAMRECIQATMFMLEEEHTAVNANAPAGDGNQTNGEMASRIAATLEDAREMLGRMTADAPDLPGNTSVAARNATAESPRKGSTWDSFLARQSAAAARNLARRTASATPGLGGDSEWKEKKEKKKNDTPDLKIAEAQRGSSVTPAEEQIQVPTHVGG